MGDSPEVVSRKAMLRTSLLAGRAARPRSEREAASAAVADALADALAGATVVAGYVPTAEEPGHGRLPGALPGRVLLPVVPARGRELSWADYDGRLAPGRFGLQEPPGPRLPATALAGPRAGGRGRRRPPRAGGGARRRPAGPGRRVLRPGAAARPAGRRAGGGGV